MTVGPPLPCPKCKRALDSLSWRDTTGGTCQRCSTTFDFFPFPALTATKTRILPQAAELAADSVCYFHGENRAEAICEGCGRLLCPVCTVTFTGQKLCPTCISAAKQSDAATVVRERMLYDSTALTVAVLPLLMWPFTAITAPIALGLVIKGWNKPCSLVRGRSRTRLIIAAVFSVAEIGGWLTGLGYYLLHR